MKSNAKSKIIILIAFGIVFALSPMITVNLIFIAGNNNKSSEYSDDTNLDKENLKLSKISERIHIINNSGWVAFKDAGNCTGEGTYSEPYIIEDLVINCHEVGSCILIENTTVYFRIENCTLFNSTEILKSGIYLKNASNSQIIDNICLNNYLGIYLSNCINYTIIGNIAKNNDYGIWVTRCWNGTIIENTIHDNEMSGIFLSSSNFANISGNTIYYNKNGIHLSSSINATIIGNLVVNNSKGIYLSGRSNENEILRNRLNDNNEYGIYLVNNCNYNNIFDNDASFNDFGILVWGCAFNTISRNTACYGRIGIKIDGLYCFQNKILENNASYNSLYGIQLYKSRDLDVSRNIANNNSQGIYLRESNYNILSENAINNNDYGILLVESNYNTITGNAFINNKECVVEVDCQGNVFSNNGSCIYGVIDISVIYLFLLVSGISAITIILYKKETNKKTNRFL